MMARSLCLPLLAAVASSLSTLGADEGIWDAPVLAQPFDKAPFRPIRVPSWVQETIGAGYTLSVMSKEQRERSVAAGVTLSEFGFVDPLFAYYDSKLLLKRNPGVPLANLDRDMAEYRRLGIKMLGVVPPGLQGEIYGKHPEWRRISSNTTEIPQVDMQNQPIGGGLCLLGPYGDYLIEILGEIVTKYPDVAAFSFDGLHCRRLLLRKLSGSVPQGDGRRDPKCESR